MMTVAAESGARRMRLVWGGAFVLAMGIAAAVVGSGDLGTTGSLAVALVPMVLLIPFIRSAERVQVEARCVTPAMRRYNRRFTAMSFAYVISLFAAIGLDRERQLQGPLLWLLALLPAVPIVGMIVTMARLLVEETDEYQRMRIIRAALIATGLLLAVASVWGFLEMFDLVPHIWAWAAFPVWAVGLALGQLGNRWIFNDPGGC